MANYMKCIAGVGNVEMSDEEHAARVAEESEWESKKSERAFQALRSERDQKLAECDWWGASDQGEMSSDRASYRKALRDLPAQFDNSSVLGEITWPSKP